MRIGVHELQSQKFLFFLRETKRINFRSLRQATASEQGSRLFRTFLTESIYMALLMQVIEPVFKMYLYELKTYIYIRIFASRKINIASLRGAQGLVSLPRWNAWRSRAKGLDARRAASPPCRAAALTAGGAVGEAGRVLELSYRLRAGGAWQ